MQVTAASAVLLAVCVMTLSDSILVPLRLARNAALRVLAGLEAGSGLDLISRSDLPVGLDTIGHFLAWTTIGFLAAGLARSAVARIGLFAGLLTLSGLLEIGQRYLSWSRTAELSDLVANGVGLGLGMTFAIILVAVFGAMASAFGTGSGASLPKAGPGS